MESIPQNEKEPLMRDDERVIEMIELSGAHSNKESLLAVLNELSDLRGISHVTDSETGNAFELSEVIRAIDSYRPGGETDVLSDGVPIAINRKLHQWGIVQ